MSNCNWDCCLITCYGCFGWLGPDQSSSSRAPPWLSTRPGLNFEPRRFESQTSRAMTSEDLFGHQFLQRVFGPNTYRGSLACGTLQMVFERILQMCFERILQMCFGLWYPTDVL